MSINQYSSTVVHFIADGVVKEFNFPFRIFAKEDIDIYVNEVLLNQGYEVEIEDESGGKVIFNQAPAINSQISIIRNLEIKRTSDFQEGGAFRAKVINHELDYQVASLQQLDEKIKRALVYPPYEQEKPNLILPIPSAGKALVWNQEANGLENSTLEIDTISQEIVHYANEAKQSEDNAKISENNAKESASKAKVSETIAVESAEKAQKYAETTSFGNIGDIKYTTRTEVPNGGVWCDGTEYTQAMFPDIYQMLIDGKLNSTSYTTFDSTVSANGSCGLFALDTATTSFKVPLLKDVYIKAGQTPLAFGAESLPNITGGTGFYTTGKEFGSFYATDYNSRDVQSAGDNARGVGFAASKSSPAYQDGAKVNPDHVVYRAYVVLYATAAGASEAQAAEFIDAVADVRASISTKANVDLRNISANIDYVIESGITNGITWEKWKSGKLVQYSIKSDSSTTVTFAKPYLETPKVFFQGASNNKSGATNEGACIMNSVPTTTSFNLIGNYSAYVIYGSWLAIGQGA